MRRKRKFKAAATATFAALSTNVPTVGAFVYPQNPGCAYARAIDWYFSGTGWTAARQAAVRTGFAGWNTLADEQSVRYIGSTEQTQATHSPRAFAVTVDPTGSWTDCSTRRIGLSAPAVAPVLTRAAAHEMGHAHGLRHGGEHDTLQTGSTLWDSFYPDAAPGTEQQGRTELFIQSRIPFLNAAIPACSAANASRRRGRIPL